jgi:hypothetical protein
MNVTEHTCEVVTSRLRDHHIVVWYDPEHAFHGVFKEFDYGPLVKVDASASVLAARRDADRAWCTLFDTESTGAAPVPLLIYVPASPGHNEESRRDDPFEPFALAGTTFGSTESEHLASLARKVLFGREKEVDRVFAEGTPSVAQLDALVQGTRYPMIQDALGTNVPSRVATWLLCRSDEIAPHLSSPGFMADLAQLLLDAFAFEAGSERASITTLSASFARWILFGEFALDVPECVPSSLAHVPRSPATFRSPIYDLCQDLRSSADYRDNYRQIADQVEKTLGLSGLANRSDLPDGRDTFPFQDSAALNRLQQYALAGQLDQAGAITHKRRTSVWRTEPKRDQLWRLAERCLQLLASGLAWESRAVSASLPVADHIRAYCADTDGMWRVDQAQRLMEQAAALLVDRDSLAPLLEHIRKEYRKWISEEQAAFLSAVEKSGWPPEEFTHHTKAWARYAAPAVSDGRRTAWFLVDALRYEMGQELAVCLATEGTVKVVPTCGVVPSATPFGMAALLPGAELSLTYGEQNGALVPMLAGRPVPTTNDRREVFRAALGDRYASIRLGELLTPTTTQLKNLIGNADVLVIFSTEIDDYGEHNDPLIARRYIGEVVADLLAATRRLAELGFERIVFGADHGFIQLPEILPGDRCPEPPGTWLLKTRRALLGTLGARTDGIMNLTASRLGIQGPAEQVCIPTGIKVFRAGSPYFHEGLSLQESLVPLVVLDAIHRRPTSREEALVEIYYRSEEITSRIFSVQIENASILTPALPVRIRAFKPGTREVVGEAVDCEARDPHTGLVTLRANQKTQVPIALDPDFQGTTVEVRVTDSIIPDKIYRSKLLRYVGLD